MDPMTLTAEDCAAIRRATGFVAHLRGDDGVTLELIRRERAKPRTDGYLDGRTSVELSRTLVGVAWTLTRATFVELYAGGAFQALARLVRPGDVLHLYAGENGNQYTREAGLYADELCVDLVRKGRLVVNQLVLHTTICPHNSARAIRPAWPAARAEATEATEPAEVR